MNVTTDYEDRTGEIIAMFEESFRTSEGPEAGEAIAQLVSDMLTSLDGGEMHVFTALEGETVVGCIIFTRMNYDRDPRQVFIMAPVAVATAVQGKGVGQRLIRHGLEALRAGGVDIALTYGDINFYAKTGFRQITEATAQAPLPLQFPEGWLGQSLTSDTFAPLVGAARCVAPLNDPDHW